MVFLANWNGFHVCVIQESGANVYASVGCLDTGFSQRTNCRQQVADLEYVNDCAMVDVRPLHARH